MKEDEDRSRDYLEHPILPFVDGHVSFRSLPLSKRQDECKRPSDFPDRLDGLLRSREFEDSVAERNVRVETGAMPALRAVEAGLGSIRALLREGMGG